MTILSHIDLSSSSFYFKVLTGCERTNKYKICNTMSQQIYFALEGKHSSVFFCFVSKLPSLIMPNVTHLSRK